METNLQEILEDVVRQFMAGAVKLNVPESAKRIKMHVDAIPAEDFGRTRYTYYKLKLVATVNGLEMPVAEEEFVCE